MMNRKSLDILKEVYKPTKITLKNKALLLDSTSGQFVLKEKKQDMRKLYDYLNSRSFSYYPSLIDDSREDINVFSYAKESYAPKEQKALDLIKMVALLHQKTSYYKDVTSDEFKKIYEELKNQIVYVRYYYENLYEEYFQKVYPSPSEYFLLTHISKILASLNYAEDTLEKWYESCENLNKYRVCQIHNNLSLDHVRENCLISWDSSRKDTPVLDLIKFYKNCYFEINFEPVLSAYLKLNSLSPEEEQLLFLTLAIPPKVVLEDNELESVKNIRDTLDYIYKTESLIRPYNTVEEKQK